MASDGDDNRQGPAAGGSVARQRGSRRETRRRKQEGRKVRDRRPVGRLHGSVGGFLAEAVEVGWGKMSVDRGPGT